MKAQNRGSFMFSRITLKNSLSFVNCLLFSMDHQVLGTKGHLKVHSCASPLLGSHVGSMEGICFLFSNGSQLLIMQAKGFCLGSEVN